MAASYNEACAAGQAGCLVNSGAVRPDAGMAGGPSARSSPAEVLATLTVFGERVEISRELLRVAGGIAAFSGLYYAIAVLTDSTYREEFLTEVTGEMRESFRLRAAYLERRSA